MTEPPSFFAVRVVKNAMLPAGTRALMKGSEVIWAGGLNTPALQPNGQPFGPLAFDTIAVSPSDYEALIKVRHIDRIIPPKENKA